MNSEVDLVYLWVDDSDKEWIKKKNQHLNSKQVYNEDAVNECRFHNNNELKYSLRSVEKYASWLNKIYIVTDKQLPEWLNVEHPKIKIVDHSEFIPNEYLPLFNSCAIETRLPFIEGLSEYFLYANDDMFFWNKVEKDFFFNDNKPIFRTEKFFKKNRIYKGLYGSTILRAFNILKTRFNTDFYCFYPHHNIDAYKKSSYLSCIKTFEEEFNETLKHRFRQENDIQRTLVAFYSIATGEAYLKKNNTTFLHKLLNLPIESRMYSLKNKKFKNLVKSRSKLVCINDNQRTTSNDREQLKKILEMKFNKKSSFEKKE